MAQGAKGVALISNARLGRQEITLVARQQERRRKSIDQAGQRRALLHLIILHRQPKNVEVGLIKLGEIIHLIGAPITEQIIQPFIGQAGNLRQPPMGFLKDVPPFS